jgi:hypothetical protein
MSAEAPEVAAADHKLARLRTRRKRTDAEEPERRAEPEATQLMPSADAEPNPAAAKITARHMTPKEAAADPKAVAYSVLNPCVQAAQSVSSWCPTGVDIPALAVELLERSTKIIYGNMDRPESMLIAQAHTLDTIFNSLARRAKANFDNGTGVFSQTGEAYLRVALRAQSQCRATLETLAVLKNPPTVAFVRQANIATAGGNQQVNNGAGPHRAHAGETEKQPIEQFALEQPDGSTQVDCGTTATAIGADSKVATVGTLKRTANAGGKGPCKP